MTVQETLQEFWDNTLHPSLKPEISEEAKTVAMKALEKQIPKKPIKVKDSTIRWTDDYICPTCENHFTGTGIANYCYHCGQAIDWEGLE